MATATTGHRLEMRAAFVAEGRGFVVPASAFGVARGDLPGWFTVEPELKGPEGKAWGVFTPARPLMEGARCAGYVYLDADQHEITVELT